MEIGAGLVRSGLGFSLLPRDFYRADIAAGRLVPLAVSPPLRPVSAARGAGTGYAAGASVRSLGKIAARRARNA